MPDVQTPAGEGGRADLLGGGISANDASTKHGAQPSVAHLPLKRRSPLADSQAAARRMAQAVAYTPDDQTAMALCRAAGRYASRAEWLRDQGVRA